MDRNNESIKFIVTAVVAVIVAALMALATIHVSKGEPTPVPPSMVSVRPATR